jgi:hypothetical protein
LGATLLFTACSNLPTAPEPEVETVESYGLLGGVLGLVGGVVEVVVDTVVGVLSPVLTRDEPLRRDEVVSETIGRRGGTIHLPRAGLTVSVPRGALSRNTRITVRAPAGDLLGYEFAPHGLEFRKPVTLSQELSGSAGDLEAIYFDGALQPEVTVLEVIPVSASRWRAVFRIDHFSGYAFRRSGYVIATN